MLSFLSPHIFALKESNNLSCIEQKTIKKPFIDSWETICPEDWHPIVESDVYSFYYAPRSVVRGPGDIRETNKIEFAFVWTKAYLKNGFGSLGPEFNQIKTTINRNIYQCHKDRISIIEQYNFSDKDAENYVTGSVYIENPFGDIPEDYWTKRNEMGINQKYFYDVICDPNRDFFYNAK